jgi:hypothetical protein
MNNRQLVNELKITTDDLLETISQFTEDQINAIPFEGSWTGGQVGEHLLKSEKGLPKVLSENIHPTDRPYDAKIPVIESIFLNFDTKLKAPEFIIPSSGPHEKSTLIESLKKVRSEIGSTIAENDLTKTCASTEFPGMGYLTQREWISFVICHSKRHTHQLKNILQKL